MKSNLLLYACSFLFLTLQASQSPYFILAENKQAGVLISQQAFIQPGAHTNYAGPQQQIMASGSYLTQPYVPKTCAAFCCLKCLCCCSTVKKENIARVWDTQICCQPNPETEEASNDC